VAYGEGDGQGGRGRHSPGWCGTGERRWWLRRQCAAAFSVDERWPMVGVEVLHHQEEGMKGEAPRMRVKSGRRW
jgi:hypothetical protein